MSWLAPTNLTKVISFMGLAGYYYHFVQDFSRIENHFTSLCKKNQTFKSNKKCKKGFTILKENLIMIPILEISYPFGYFMVYIDSSLLQLGGILS